MEEKEEKAINHPMCPKCGMPLVANGAKGNLVIASCISCGSRFTVDGKGNIKTN